MLAVIIGRRRQGKSTLALSLAVAKKQTVIVFDPNNQYEALNQITDIGEFMENSTPDSIGRIVPTDPKTDWEALTAELDGGQWNWGEYTLIVDECSMLMSPSYVHPVLERYARTCPKDVHIVLTTHRTVDVHTLFRALATDWFIFQQHLDRDLENIADNLGADVALESKSLPNYHVIHYWLEAGGLPNHEIWDKPDEWFIDIGRTT